MTSLFVDSTMAHALTRGMEEGRRRENSFGIKGKKKRKKKKRVGQFGQKPRATYSTE